MHWLLYLYVCLEIMKLFSMVPLPSSTSIISLQKSGHLLDRMRGESLKTLSSVADKPLEFVGGRGRCVSTFIQGHADTCRF